MSAAIHIDVLRPNQTSGRTPQTFRNGGAAADIAFRHDLKLVNSCPENVPVLSVPSIGSWRFKQAHSPHTDECGDGRSLGFERTAPGCRKRERRFANLRLELREIPRAGHLATWRDRRLAIDAIPAGSAGPEQSSATTASEAYRPFRPHPRLAFAPPHAKLRPKSLKALRPFRPRARAIVPTVHGEHST
jgi:hypothetical protein